LYEYEIYDESKGDEESHESKGDETANVDVTIPTVTYDKDSYPIKRKYSYIGLEICPENHTIPLNKIMSLITERGTHDILKKLDPVFIGDGHGNHNEEQCTEWYDIDDNNKMYLNKKHYDRVINKIQEVKLFDTIIDDKLGRLKLNFPQMKKKFESETFCNSTYYGKLKVIEVTGFLKIE
jgi:hypothetical protein